MNKEREMIMDCSLVKRTTLSVKTETHKAVARAGSLMPRFGTGLRLLILPLDFLHWKGFHSCHSTSLWSYLGHLEVLHFHL